MKHPVKHLQDEADIGSGEKGPAELETEKMIEQIGEKNPASPTEDETKSASNAKPAA